MLCRHVLFSTRKNIHQKQKNRTKAILCGWTFITDKFLFGDETARNEGERSGTETFFSRFYHRSSETSYYLKRPRRLFPRVFCSRIHRDPVANTSSTMLLLYITADAPPPTAAKRTFCFTLYIIYRRVTRSQWNNILTKATSSPITPSVWMFLA